MISYISSNISNQTIDEINIGSIQSVDYKIKVYSGVSISQSKINVSTDGVLIFETQSGSSSTNTSPLEFTTQIENYIGKLKVQPISNNNVFTIEKIEYPSILYASHTQSGRKIRSEEGISLDRESTLNSLTIRKETQNYYGNSSPYLISNVFGPIKQNLNLLNSWISYNNADIFEETNLEIISSGQADNFGYQEIQVIPGKAYSIFGEGYYELPSDVIVKENALSQTGSSFIRISESLDNSEILNHQLTTTNSSFDLVFFPTTEIIYVKIGYGLRSTKTILNNLQVKEILPFPTFNQNYGTYYLKWSGLNNVDLFKCNNILRLESNNILYNDVNIGTQLTTNQLCISYTPESISVSLNGSITQDYVINNIDKNYILELNPSILKFSYMNENISDMKLESLSSG